MAVGPTEALQSPQLFQLQASQQNASNRMIGMMNSLMFANLTVRTNNDAAIPPANFVRGVETTAGIGVRIDLNA